MCIRDRASWGSRMHQPYLTTGGISIDIPLYLWELIRKWFMNFPIKLNEIHTVLTLNRIWKVRLADVGIITKKMIEAYVLSGILVRSSGLVVDLRFLG